MAPLLPRLRFEDGDLVVKIDRNPMRWLIIHSKVFAAVSPVFKADITSPWKGPADVIKHPRTGDHVEVLTLVNDKGDTTFDPPESARALHTFFAIIYGATITLEHTPGERRVTPYLLLDILSLADFWGCFATIRPALTNALQYMQRQANPALDKDVAHNPQAYALLAKRLEIEPIYNDALRHLVASAYTSELGEAGSGGWDWEASSAHWTTIAELMELDEEEVLNVFPFQLDWAHDPSAQPPEDGVLLEGRGWSKWEWPRAAKAWHSEDPLKGRYTNLAMPMCTLPWKREVERVEEEGSEEGEVVEEEGVVDLAAVVSAVSFEHASGAWVWELVARLRE